MNRIQRGRGGWVAEVGGLTRAVGIVLVVIGLAIGGCSSKKKANEGAGLNPNGVGMNDQNLLIGRITKPLNQRFRCCLSRRKPPVRLSKRQDNRHQSRGQYQCQEFLVHARAFGAVPIVRTS